MTPTYPPQSKSDDFDDEDDERQETGSGGRNIVKHVVKDLASAIKMRRITAKSDADARKAEAKAAMAQVRAEERRRKDELRSEIAKLRLQMTAREAASKHIAVFGPLYLMLLVGLFLGALGTGLIQPDHVPVVSALLTLLVTMIGANLRSIVSEGNGSDEHDAPDTKKKGPF
tara:strand:- start:12681 stop:13196 length:516 start_codon:yes stop_codon:yes gene_type:complete